MKCKTIEIPIYQCNLTIIHTTDLTEVAKKYKLKNNFNDFHALTFKDDNKYRHFVVVFTDATHLSNIAHEIVHLKNFIFLDCAMEVDRYNDEPEAYLTGWLFGQINDFLKTFKSE